MYILVLIVHIVVSLLLIAVILVQGGRGGMTETLGGAAAQSLFGGGAGYVQYLMNQKIAPGLGYILSNTEGPFSELLRRAMDPPKAGEKK